MKYSVGDRVRFMDFEEDGVVVAVLDDTTLMVEADGMRMRASVSELVPLSSASAAEEERLYEGNNQVSRFKQRQSPSGKSVRSGKKSMRSAGTMEVDLHLEKIRMNYPAARSIPNQDALFLQLEIFEKSMAEAFRKGVRSVVFIHGNGRGVLRRELEKRLKEYPGVTYCDASFLRYGGGALEVFLK